MPIHDPTAQYFTNNNIGREKMILFSLFTLVVLAGWAVTDHPPVQGYRAPKHNTKFEIGFQRWRNRGCAKDMIGKEYAMRDGDCFSASDRIPFRGYQYQWNCPSNCDRDDDNMAHKVNCSIKFYSKPNCDESSGLGRLYDAQMDAKLGSCGNAGGAALSAKLFCEKLDHAIVWPSSTTWNPYTEATPSSTDQTLLPWQTVTATATVTATTMMTLSTVVTLTSTAF